MFEDGVVRNVHRNAKACARRLVSKDASQNNRLVGFPSVVLAWAIVLQAAFVGFDAEPGSIEREERNWIVMLRSF